ncbi:MAG: GTPase [Lachnospiraceae bacterium]|nr:GTPase [Lachnospiraceae bacterium]
METIAVYLFTGFMDSGKTSLIKETLVENGFGIGNKNLIIVCEDGEEEYDEEALSKMNTDLVFVEEEEDFNTEFIETCVKDHKPDNIFIEYNGTWEVASVIEDVLPKSCELVQVLTTVDSTTFNTYLTNMRAIMMEQMFLSDVVIFNRSDENTPKMKFRTAVKTNNRKAQIVYEKKDGTIDEEPEPLPYDLSQDVIEISDMNYGIWFMDCQDNPKNYVGKTVSFLALVYNPDKMKSGVFVPGRFAMTCCVDDIQFIGFKAKYNDSKKIPHKSWVYVTAEIKHEFAIEYKGKGPVLYVKDLKPAEKPEDELVYFN